MDEAFLMLDEAGTYMNRYTADQIINADKEEKIGGLALTEDNVLYL